MSEELYYLRDSRGNCGTSAMFWAAKGGYTTNLNNAEKFSREKAVSQYNSRDTDIPCRCDLVDAKSYFAVDMQYLPEPSICDENYIVFKGIYDGNNIVFRGPARTCNLHCVRIHNSEDTRNIFKDIDYVEAYPASVIKALARPVIAAIHVDERLMLRKAKIKLKRAKKYKPSSGMERYNCRQCGVFVWTSSCYGPHYCGECLFNRQVD